MKQKTLHGKTRHWSPSKKFILPAEKKRASKDTMKLKNPKKKKQNNGRKRKNTLQDENKPNTNASEDSKSSNKNVTNSVNDFNR